jgi:hypothetical protein
MSATKIWKQNPGYDYEINGEVDIINLGDKGKKIKTRF